MKSNESIRELLLLDGIKTVQDFEELTARKAKPGESRYNVLKRLYGQVNADRIMRLVEVRSW